MKDKLLILKLIVICRIAAPSGIKNTSTIDYLNQFGFSARFIKLFWEPFLTGILLDPALKIDAEFFIFLVKAFSSGRAGVPSLGMQEIPRQIAVGLNADSIRLNVPVKELANNYVVLNTLEKIDAKNVVVAYNQSLDADSYRSVQNFYFTTSEPLEWGRWLVLVPPEYGFNILTVAVMNQVAPAYGNKSMESLLSVSVVKTKDITPEKLKLELRKIARKPLNDLKFIKSFAIPNALPKMNRLKCSNFDVVNGVYYCGDYASGPSINGALKSGRLVGESIARNFTE